MSVRQVRIVWVAAVVVLVAAAALRLTDLGWAPLNDSEAIAALAAAGGTPAESPFWTPVMSETASAAYQSLTGPLFVLFGGSDGLARLIPALAGIGVVALPLLLVDRFGWPVAIGAAGSLAISSTAMYTSRTADGTALALLGAGVFWLAAVRHDDTERWLPVAGFGLGVAFSSGASIWMGLFGLLIGLVAWRLGGDSARTEGSTMSLRPVLQRMTLLVAAITLVLFSTRFGFRPGTFADVIASPGQWLSGWVEGSEHGPLSLLWMLLIYEPLLLFGGIFGAILALRSPWSEREALVYWAGGALLAYLIYPGRSPEQLMWVVFPASFLFGYGLDVFLRRSQSVRGWQAPAALVGLLLLLGAFTYALLQQVGGGVGMLQLTGVEQAVFGAAAVGIIGALIALFGLGWSWRDTSLALTAFVAVSLALVTTSASFTLTHDPASEPSGIWSKRNTTVNVRLLSGTVEALSSAHIGRTEGMKIGLVGQATPTLAWEIRDYEPWEGALGETEEPPPVILAPDGRDVELPADYLGQAFAVYERSLWPGALPPNPLTWWLDRRAPKERESWVLFVRADVAGLDERDSFPTPNGN